MVSSANAEGHVLLKSHNLSEHGSFLPIGNNAKSNLCCKPINFMSMYFNSKNSNKEVSC